MKEIEHQMSYLSLVAEIRAVIGVTNAPRKDKAKVCIWTASCVIIVVHPMTQVLVVKTTKGAQTDGLCILGKGHGYFA